MAVFFTNVYKRLKKNSAPPLHFGAGFGSFFKTIFLRKFLSLSNKPELIVLMLQREVAQRIVAQAPDMSLLSASVQFYAQAEILFEVGRDKFYPAPEVDSAVIRIKPMPNRLKSYEEEKRFFSILKIFTN